MPFALELARLVGPAAGDQRERRPVRADDRELLGAQLGGTKPRMPTPQGRSPSSVAVLASSDVGLGPAHQGEREERQRPALGHRGGELGAVADPRHRPLHDRIARAVRLRQRPALGERVLRRERLAGVRDRRAQRRR